MKNTHMFGQGKSQEAFEPEIFLILNLNKLVKAEIWILPPWEVSAIGHLCLSSSEGFLIFTQNKKAQQSNTLLSLFGS